MSHITPYHELHVLPHTVRRAPKMVAYISDKNDEGFNIKRCLVYVFGKGNYRLGGSNAVLVLTTHFVVERPKV